MDGWVCGLMGGLVAGWIEGCGTENLPSMQFGSIIEIFTDVFPGTHATSNLHRPVNNVMSLNQALAKSFVQYRRTQPVRETKKNRKCATSFVEHKNIK